MKKIPVLLVAWFALICAGRASADEDKKLIGKVTRAERSALEVLKREKCDPLWLSSVVHDSKLSGFNWRKLPIGTPLYLRALSCKATPPEAVASKSEALMAPPAVLKSEPPIKPATVRVVTEKADDPHLEALEASLRGIEAENDQLRKDIKLLTDQLLETETKRANAVSDYKTMQGEMLKLQAAPRRYLIIFLPIAFIGGVIVGVAAALLMFRRRKSGPPRASPNQRVSVDVDPSLHRNP